MRWCKLGSRQLTYQQCCQSFPSTQLVPVLELALELALVPGQGVVGPCSCLQTVPNRLGWLCVACQRCPLDALQARL